MAAPWQKLALQRFAQAPSQAQVMKSLKNMSGAPQRSDWLAFPWIASLQVGPLHVPQMPFVQLPLQHCALVVQVRPSALQAGPHLPAVQVPLQHCALVVQVRPSALQGTPHLPFEQTPLQHCVLVVQVRPSALQAGPHLPAVQVPLQQPALVVQARPSALQLEQLPFTQAPLQQAAFAEQDKPSIVHCAQMPFVQAPPQQFALVAQVRPSALQFEQEPFLQVLPSQHSEFSTQGVFSFAQHWLSTPQDSVPQQSELPPQDSPTLLQCAHMPWVQTLEQQSLARAQAVLSPWQEPHLSL